MRGGPSSRALAAAPYRRARSPLARRAPQELVPLGSGVQSVTGISAVDVQTGREYSPSRKHSVVVDEA